MKLTFIGNGNMAKALIEGLVENYEIEVFGRNKQSFKFKIYDSGQIRK